MGEACSVDEPDNAPMSDLVEWRATDGGWVQVTEDSRRAGHGILNLAASDIDGARELRETGLETGPIVEADKGVRLCLMTDPDDNRIHLVGNFGEKYWRGPLPSSLHGDDRVLAGRCR